MEPEIQNKIEETVLEVLKNSNMDETTEYKVRKLASEKLGIDLSQPDHRRFVRQVVDSYLNALESKEEEQPPEEEEEQEQEEDGKRKGVDQKEYEYDDEGDLIICRLTKNRRVTVTDFRGKTLVSIREYYRKEGKELPTSKGISLTAEQWSSFKKNVPAIEKAIRKMESRLN
ncbi:unnamed protein product [Ilex paraguariensis]|uniref:DEK-C domain-containing protein n=1 Tax=Ilex paraguariensis TaxID=185542 RepID=A0ABC8T121_9AQUA